MAAIEKISVALPKDMLELVKKAVKSGDYATTSEVIREALREWKGRETREETLAEVRRLVQEGLDSKEWFPLDTEEVKREGRRCSSRHASPAKTVMSVSSREPPDDRTNSGLHRDRQCRGGRSLDRGSKARLVAGSPSLGRAR